MDTTKATEYTVKDAAELIGAGESTIRKYAAELQAPKFGRDYRLTDEHIEAMRAKATNPHRTGRRVAVRQPAPVRKPRARKGAKAAPAAHEGMQYLPKGPLDEQAVEFYNRLAAGQRAMEGAKVIQGAAPAKRIIEAE